MVILGDTCDDLTSQRVDSDCSYWFAMNFLVSGLKLHDTYLIMAIPEDQMYQGPIVPKAVLISMVNS